MTEHEILQLIGKLILSVLSGIGGAFFLARVWGQKWIETKFQKDLEAFKAQNLHDLSLLLTRKVKWHEKEQDVLSVSWVKLINAFNKLSLAINVFREVTDLNRMSEDSLNSFLSDTKLGEREKKYILGQEDKTKAYIRVLEVNALNDAQKAFSEFHTYYDDNRIFLNPAVKKKFLDVDDYIWKAWVAQKMSFGAYTNTDLNMKAYDTMREKVKPLIDEIEILLQEKLFPEPNNQ